MKMSYFFRFEYDSIYEILFDKDEDEDNCEDE